MEDLLQVGVITSVHGVRGEVKVYPTTDEPKRFKKLKKVILDDGRTRSEAEITSVKFFKNMVIVKLAGFDSRDDAQRLRQAKLLITREQAVPLKKDEYFIADLIGLRAVSDEGEELGAVSDVLSTGANDVYVISREDTPDLLVPAIRDCILDVNIDEGRMCIHLLPGLRE